MDCGVPLALMKLLGLAAFFNLNYKIIKNYNEIAYTKGYSL
jgi:hypothetical protein